MTDTLPPLPPGAVSATVPPLPPGAERVPSWSEVPGQALANFPGSAWNLAKSTAEGAGEMGKWLMNPAVAPPGVIESIAHPVVTAQKMWDGLVGSYGSEEAVRRKLANDPAGALADLASLIGGGEILAAKALPEAGLFSRTVRAVAPTATELSDAANAGYKTFRDLDVKYHPAAVADRAAAIRSALEKDGIFGEHAPKTFATIKRLETYPPGSFASSANLESARRAFGNAAKDFTNPTERLAASVGIDAIDDFVTRPPPHSVLSGPAQRAAEVVAKARSNYAALKRSEQVTGVEDAADLRAGAANSGLNVGNTIRQRTASLLLDKKRVRGYSEPEREALTRVVNGSTPANVTRSLGNILGGGGGLGALTAGGLGELASQHFIGGLPGVLVGMVPPAAGLGLRYATNSLTRKALAAADEMIRHRSALGAAAGPPVMVPSSYPPLLLGTQAARNFPVVPDYNQ